MGPGALSFNEVTVKIHGDSTIEKMGARLPPVLVRMADVLKQFGIKDASNTTV